MNFQNVYAGHLTAPEFKENAPQSRGVILVCGSCEQHGYSQHYPYERPLRNLEIFSRGMVMDTSNLINQLL